MGIANSVIANFIFAPPSAENYTWETPYHAIPIITRTNKTIPVYYLKSSNPSEKRTILYSHGNATDLGEMYPFVAMLRDKLDLNVLFYEYIGYGLARNEDKPSEEGVYESVDAAFAFLQMEGVRPHDIIVFGTSVGSGPSVYTASKHKDVRGLILECPFTSITRIVKGGGAVVNMTGIDLFPNIDRISEVACPVYIMHGIEDTVVPVSHGKQLYEKVVNKYPPVWIAGANHNNIRGTLGRKYIEGIKAFLEALNPPLTLNSGSAATPTRGLARSNSAIMRRHNEIFGSDSDSDDDSDDPYTNNKKTTTTTTTTTTKTNKSANGSTAAVATAATSPISSR